MDWEKYTDPPNAVNRTGLLLRIFAWSLLVASIWGLVNLVQLWSRPMKLVSGTPGPVIEEHEAGRFRYLVPFTVDETDEAFLLRLDNDGPVIDYFATSPGTQVAVLYWSEDMGIASVHPLVAGEASIRGRYPPYNALLGTSALGILVAVVLLVGGWLDSRLYRLGRG